jgi:histidyl-tRNA synthetase
MQFDADTVGSASMAADAEMCMLAADTMEALGIARGQYVVKVNNRKILDGVMDTVSVPKEKHLTTMRAIDKLDRLGVDGVRQLLGEGRKDESGDYTKGAGLNTRQIDSIVHFLSMSSKVSAEIQTGASLPKNVSDQDRADWYIIDEMKNSFAENGIISQGLEELEAIWNFARRSGYGIDQIRIDPSVVRGLEYYTGPVYEVELLLETKDEKGRPVRFGSVGGGGRYDGLVSRFRGEPCPATGFSIGVSRLQAALTLIGKLDAKPQPGPVLVTVFGPDNVAGSQALVATLRNAGIRAELYLGNPKHGIGQQLKYADKRHAPCAVIQGPDEKAKGEVIVRDLIAGAAPSDTADRDAHLKKQAEAQKAVSESAMVEEVRAILSRHALS